MGIFDNINRGSKGNNSEQTGPRRGGANAPGKWQVGDMIQNQYEIRKILGGPGRSGMGIVYVCYDREFNINVALKTFQDRYLQDPTAIEAFKREADAWFKLGSHPNIVRAYWVTEISGKPYVLMEYIEGHERYGTDLSGWIHQDGLHSNGRPDIPKILNFAIQICCGMDYAYDSLKIVHRDIKPANILVSHDGKSVKVTDFGLVKVLDELNNEISMETDAGPSFKKYGLSKMGKVCGTPPYMSPEQCLGSKEVDIRSDIYSLGCVLYEMLTKNYVFEARSLDQFIHHHLNTEPESPGVHNRLDEIVLTCLEKDPEQRYEDWIELEEALSEVYKEITGETAELPVPNDESYLPYYLPDILPDIYKQAWNLNNEGLTNAELGNHTTAIDYYLKALEILPDYPVPYSNMGKSHAALGNMDDAIEAFEDSVRIQPGYCIGHCNLGLAYYYKNRLDEAEVECKKAIRISPGYAVAHNNLGLIYVDMEKFDEAEQELLIAIELNPYDEHAHNNLGNVYFHCDMLDEAIEEYMEVIRLNPNHIQAYNNLANIYQVQGEVEKAVTFFQKFIEIAPPQYASYIEMAKDRIRRLKERL